jgi:hypothetical protein
LTGSNRAGKLMPFLPAKSNRDAGGVARMERSRDPGTPLPYSASAPYGYWAFTCQGVMILSFAAC